MNRGPVNNDLKVIFCFDLQTMVKLADEPASNNFLALLVLNPLIGDKAPGALEVVREFGLSLKAASDLSQYETTADQDARDNLAKGSLLG
jgi:hypothetical protein